MAEKEKTHTTPFDKYFPEEARQHAKTARQEMRKGFEAFLPPEFVEHRRAAQKEMLMAARSVIDAALERIEE